MSHRTTVTLADVAAEAQVSKTSVANVIHNRPHVRPAVRERVTLAIEKLGYRPLAIGKHLRTGTTGQVILAIPNFAQPYFAELARDAVANAAEFGLTLVVQQTDNDLDRERAVADSWNLGSADGLIFSPSSITDEELESRRRGMPVVLLGEHSRLSTVDRVSIPSLDIARTATEHLLDSGCRHIAMIGHKDTGDSFVVSEREEGFHAALAGRGLTSVGAVGQVVDWTRADGEAATEAILALHPDIDGLFCANDLLALGALRAIRRSGRRIPDDIAVVGIDDIEESYYSEPGLTTVRIDRNAMMRTAFELLSRRINEPDRKPIAVDVKHSLVIRETTERRGARLRPVTNGRK